MARHGERYPTKSVSRRIKALVERMQDSGIDFQGDLAFFNNWTLFWTSEPLRLLKVKRPRLSLTCFR